MRIFFLLCFLSYTTYRRLGSDFANSKKPLFFNKKIVNSSRINSIKDNEGAEIKTIKNLPSIMLLYKESTDYLYKFKSTNSLVCIPALSQKSGYAEHYMIKDTKMKTSKYHPTTIQKRHLFRKIIKKLPLYASVFILVVSYIYSELSRI